MRRSRLVSRTALARYTVLLAGHSPLPVFLDDSGAIRSYEEVGT